MPFARLPHTKLFFEVHGDGLPLLCVMGFGAPLEGFALQAKALAPEGRKVILFDNRGVGRSSSPRLPWTTEDLARDTVELMDHLKVTRADVLGVSMGGMVAQHLAISQPERVNALVLAASFANADLPLRRSVASLTAQSVSNWIARGLGGREAFERALRLAWEGHVVADAPLDAEGQAILDRGWDLRKETNASDIGMLGQLSALLTHDARAKLGRIRAPTLVIAGSADLLSPMSQARTLARLIPGARLEILAGAPHGMNLASAPLFNATIRAFLAKHSPVPEPAADPLAKRAAGS